MSSETIGWIGTVFLLIATWNTHPKRRWPFLFVAAGEVVWFIASVMKQSPSMAFLCVVFFILALRNFGKWYGD